ncbi:hypothetical protein SAMN05421780_11530 [Flexibacter flexilis DSM 6793]|uniref:Cytochrome C and Quinol oxidase polypeptide I n=1 Tax=Flexibacter flexilis DSM 6793 TaxID=927664 RepID=A0A1I1NQZ2_9BACT|nr:hypothetical protein [Flexibacter flexilis]SFC97183.1 hypothetical protein SAMN05421780_11530 [Flexibacter flexilis DSM 6793]
MYPIVLQLHSAFRWLVLGSLLWAIGQAYIGYTQNKAFLPSHNRLRHWTATIAHIQLLLGFTLYGHSPIVKYFWRESSSPLSLESLFFPVIHLGLMLVAIVIITIGSAKAKRQTTDTQKFKTIFVWFLLGLCIILLAVPWPFSPFSPLSARPLFR